MTEKQTFASVAIVSRSLFRFFMPALAQVIKDRHGSEVHLYCTTLEQKREYQRTAPAGLFASINAVDHHWPKTWPENVDEAAVFRRATDFEERYGLTINSLAVFNRILGRGYALGGFHYPRSRQSEGMKYVHMVHAFNEHLGFWEREVAAKRFTLMLQPGRDEAVVARAFGIPVRNMEPARLFTRYLWAVDEFQRCPDIKDAYDRIHDPEGGPIIEKPTLGHLKARKAALDKASLRRTFSLIARSMAQNVYWRLRGYQKAGVTPLREQIAYRLRQRRDMLQVTSPDLMTLDKLGDRPFVFFSLHTEPERSLQGLSPEYFFQLSCIASISRDLPAGYLLAVKEHSISVGQRPTDFYRQIREFKNVVMLDVREYGLEVVKRSSAIVTITGSIGVEGASLGKPVIAFGRHVSYSFLPHVRIVAEDGQLAGYLREALCQPFDAERAKRDGKRFLKAVEQASFDMDKRIDSDPLAFDATIVENCYRTLVASLRHGAFLEDPMTKAVPRLADRRAERVAG